MESNPTLRKNEWVQQFGFGVNARVLEPGRIISPHWHNYYEIEIIVRGAVNHNLNNNSYLISDKCIYFLTPLDYHALECTAETEIINIAFTQNMINSRLTSLLGRRSERTLIPSDSAYEYLTNRAMRLKEEQRSNLFNTEIASSIITEIMYIIMRNLSNDCPFEQSPTLLQSAIDIISKHYTDSISINSVADALHITPQYLGKLFKETMNVSMTDYINNLRLKHACSMLIHSDTPVKEIAYESGYNSVEYFLYIFKKNLHTTPTQYRSINKTETL